MRYLLDTNVVSELRKGVRCDASVTAWEQAELIPHGGAVSVITLGEIRASSRIDPCASSTGSNREKDTPGIGRNALGTSRNDDLA